MEEFIDLIKKTNPEVGIKLKNEYLELKGDIYLWELLDKVSLPENLRIKGNIFFGEDIIDKIPKGLNVTGALVCDNNKISVIPLDLKVGSLSLGYTSIRKLPQHLNHFKWSLSLRGCRVSELPSNLTVKYMLCLDSTEITKVPKGIKTKHLSLQYTKIKTLPIGFKLKGSLDLTGSEIESLPPNMKIGGDLILEDCKKITNLPEGLFVGGVLNIKNSAIDTLPSDIIILNEKIEDKSYFPKENNDEKNYTTLNEFEKTIASESDQRIIGKLHEDFIKNNPKNPFAYEKTMIYYYSQKKYEKVESTYKRAVKKNAYIDSMSYVMGLSYYNKHDYKIAYHYASVAYESFVYREITGILVIKILIRLIRANTENEYKLSKKWLDRMKFIITHLRKDMKQSKEIKKNAEKINKYYELIKRMEVDLKENRRITDKMNQSVFPKK